MKVAAKNLHVTKNKENTLGLKGNTVANNALARPIGLFCDIIRLIMACKKGKKTK